MREDFGILLLTHGRADNICTVETLRRAGYGGKLFIVIDDEDADEPKYREKFGDKVVQFCKSEVDSWTDRGDNNAEDKRAILWARNASFGIAKNLGLRYFMMFEDDFAMICIRSTDAEGQFLHGAPVRHFEDFIEMAIEFLEATGADSVCFGQGGDFIGGIKSRGARTVVKLKAMNSFICRADRPIRFCGRFNEDVTNYVRGWMTGHEFYTIMPVMIGQKPTATVKGGMTEAYNETGTYVKSIMSVMYAPSALRIAWIGVTNFRVHHNVIWNNAAPKILRENVKKK